MNFFPDDDMVEPQIKKDENRRAEVEIVLDSIILDFQDT